MPAFAKSSLVPAPLHDLRKWHFQSKALLRLLPPWSGARVLEIPPALADGAIVRLDVPVPPLRRKEWVSRIEKVDPERCFTDVQVSGPFRSWEHEHSFLAGDDEGTSRIQDSLTYEMKEPGPIAHFASKLVDAQLVKMFLWRHRRTRNDVSLLRATDWVPRTVLISGGSGLVGTSLRELLSVSGCTVRRLVRRDANLEQGEYRWDPEAGTIDPAAFEGVDAVVNLSGAGIADARWTKARKELIERSRIDSTGLLARTIASIPGAKPALISASAVGYYGNRPEGLCDESQPAGEGFLARTCVSWEAACRPARESGARVANLRIGIVLSWSGGALAKLRLPTSLGLGGPIGDGRQGMSWIALDDLVGIIAHAIVDTRYQGPINCVAPNPVTNREFMRSLGSVLRRPAILPMPAVAARAAFGEMAQEALIEGVRAHPGVLEGVGYPFMFPELAPALGFELGQFS
ncbi:MAG: TIGR01777 family oxidoreductase [Planctomycetota bacterium]|nr:TIGR01777 family oxidoreductase [Planctomycetota bacterium]